MFKLFLSPTALLPTITITLTLTLALALPSSQLITPSLDLVKRAHDRNINENNPLPCNGLNSAYILTFPPPKPNAQVLPHAVLGLVSDFADELNALGGDLSSREFSHIGILVVEFRGTPYEPYPPGRVARPETAKREARGFEGVKREGGRVVERDGDGEGVGGQPFPLNIKNTDVAMCLNILVWYWVAQTVKETKLAIVHAETGRVVAKGEVEFWEA